MHVHTNPLTWQHVLDAAKKAAERNAHRNITTVYGIPTGGWAAAILVAKHLNAKIELDLTPTIDPHDLLIIDDLVDSGETLSQYENLGHIDTLYRKPTSPKHLAPDATTIDGWAQFPWDTNTTAEHNVTRLLEAIGEDPKRDGLIDTPKRVVKALREMTEGYDQNPAEILKTTFAIDNFDEMVILKNIPFTSLCEHHLLPFHGTATIGYLPKKGGRAVGLSKLARLTKTFAKRLQIQERLTKEIAEALYQHVEAAGVGVVLTAHHTCMSCRGIQTTGEMVTSTLLGTFRTDHQARSEFLTFR